MIMPNKYIKLSSSIIGQSAVVIRELKKHPNGIFCNNLQDIVGIKTEKIEYSLLMLFALGKIRIDTLDKNSTDIKVHLL